MVIVAEMGVNDSDERDDEDVEEGVAVRVKVCAPTPSNV